MISAEERQSDTELGQREAALQAEIGRLERLLRAARENAALAFAERNYVVHDRDILSNRLRQAHLVELGLAIGLLLTALGASIAVFG